MYKAKVVKLSVKPHPNADREQHAEGQSTMDSTHICEGVVVRVEKRDGTIKAYKRKSFEFKVLEGILKAQDDYVDTEEIS